jgi:hypothetical protein
MSIWVIDLLGLWADRDLHDQDFRLGFPSVSPTFARFESHSSDNADVWDYTETEIEAMGTAVDKLAENHPDLWKALMRSVKPWFRKSTVNDADETELVKKAVVLLEKYVNEAL